LLPSKEAAKRASAILKEFESHPANNHEFFKYLEDLAKQGITPEQFLVYRDNFFYRTDKTFLLLAIHAAKAINNHDYRALANVGRNFADEAGHGDLEAVHLKLLEEGHNLHGQIVFWHT
jgi:hypothetical protein